MVSPTEAFGSNSKSRWRTRALLGSALVFVAGISAGCKFNPDRASSDAVVATKKSVNTSRSWPLSRDGSSAILEFKRNGTASFSATLKHRKAVVSLTHAICYGNDLKGYLQIKRITPSGPAEVPATYARAQEFINDFNLASGGVCDDGTIGKDDAPGIIENFKELNGGGKDPLELAVNFK